MKSLCRLALVLLFGSTVSSTRAAPPAPDPGFWLTGLAPGTYAGRVTALNKDGSMAAGWNQFPVTYNSPGYTWTREKGRDDFGLLPGTPDASYTYGLSDTGTAVGVMYNWGGGSARAFRWTGSGQLEDLGTLGYKDSYAWGINGDGSVIVGQAEDSGPWLPPSQAFRWTPTGGMQGLGWLPQSGVSLAKAVSRDGSTIVGISMVGLDDRAFIWTEPTGMKALPFLPGTAYPWCGAYAVNADGSVVVGESYASDGYSYAVRWVNGKVMDITNSSFPNSIARAVSNDGLVIAGAWGQLGVIWTVTTGMLLAKDYLAVNGVIVPPDINIWQINAVSGDGRTFGGLAVTPNGGMGFVATIPEPGGGCPPDCDASGSLNIDDFICFQTFFALGDAKADCDLSGALDIDDFICFQTLFALGC